MFQTFPANIGIKTEPGIPIPYFDEFQTFPANIGIKTDLQDADSHRARFQTFPANIGIKTAMCSLKPSVISVSNFPCKHRD